MSSPPPVPKPAAKFLSDFLIVTEFNEQEGPIPLLVVPESAVGSFSINNFAVRIMAMAVDYQSKFEADALPTDSDVVLSDETENLYAYVHHFTLQDVYARGYVRPVALSFVTNSRDKIFRNFDDLHTSFCRVARELKAGNWNVFRRDLMRRLVSVRYTERLLRRRLPVAMQERWWEHLRKGVEMWSDEIDGPQEHGLDLEGLLIPEVISDLVDLEMRLRRLYGRRKPLIERALRDKGSAPNGSPTNSPPSSPPQSSTAVTAASAPTPAPEPPATGPGSQPRNLVQPGESDEIGALVRQQEALDDPRVPLDPPDPSFVPPAATSPAPADSTTPPPRPCSDLRGRDAPEGDEPEPPPQLLLPPSRYKCIAFEVSLRTIDRLCGATDVFPRVDEHLRAIRAHFARPLFVMQLERDDALACMHPPLGALLTIGRCATIHMDPALELAATEYCMPPPTYSAPQPPTPPLDTHPQDRLRKQRGRLMEALGARIEALGDQVMGPGGVASPVPPPAVPEQQHDGAEASPGEPGRPACDTDSVSEAGPGTSPAPLPPSPMFRQQPGTPATPPRTTPGSPPPHSPIPGPQLPGMGTPSVSSSRSSSALVTVAPLPPGPTIIGAAAPFTRLTADAALAAAVVAQGAVPLAGRTAAAAAAETALQDALASPLRAGAEERPHPLGGRGGAAMLRTDSTSSFEVVTVDRPRDTGPPVGLCAEMAALAKTHYAASLFDRPAFYPSDLLKVFQRYSYMRHIVFSLLRGCPVVILAHTRNRAVVAAMVGMLSMFVPGPPSIALVDQWRTQELTVESLATLRLCGYPKALARLRQGVVDNVALWDFEGDTFRGVPFRRGPLFERMFPMDTTTWRQENLSGPFLAHLQAWLLRFAAKGFLYHTVLRLFERQLHPMLAPSHFPYYPLTPYLVPLPECYRRLLAHPQLAGPSHRVAPLVTYPHASTVLRQRKAERQKIMDHLDLQGDDRAIVRYLAEVVQNQQRNPQPGAGAVLRLTTPTAGDLNGVRVLANSAQADLAAAQQQQQQQQQLGPRASPPPVPIPRK
ncbi:hypothetical protein PAPYR_2929 [Paratrimastix pyriformis]|uniref:UDENN FLCN/SMCR8-type domain-containing protein n=1 Tax=Paratrimastix pyriformis TaxID=342808 RepID=A0ABQ8UQH8_9EUKA|nr:hypothetical protein PAPYR_2929 [Paratrimastix pyriformis]